VHFGANTTPLKIVGRQAYASTDIRDPKERGPSKSHITTMDRGSLLAYLITSSKVKRNATNTKNNVPRSGRLTTEKLVEEVQ